MFINTKEFETEAPVVINLDRVCYVERYKEDNLIWYFDPHQQEDNLFTEDDPKIWTFLNTICEDVTKIKLSKPAKSKKEG